MMSSDQEGEGLPRNDDGLKNDGLKSGQPEFQARYAPVTSPEDQYQAPQKTGSSGRCLIYSCLGIFVGGLFLILCAGFGTYAYVTKQVEKYTAEAPSELPTVEYSEEQLAELKARISDFQDDCQESSQEDLQENPPEGLDPVSEVTGKPAGPAGDGADKKTSPKQFVLTSDDINALIAREEKLKGKLFVQIEEGKLTGEISVPTEGLLPGGKGRFINASGTFEVRLENGNLYVMLVEAEVKGERIPPHFMGEIRKQNLARDWQLDPSGAKAMAKISDIQIEDDRMIVTLKPPESATIPEQTATKSPAEVTAEPKEAPSETPAIPRGASSPAND